MQMVAWVSTPLMAIAADEPAADPVAWGLITNGKKIPKNFVWDLDQAIADAGKYSFRFANGSTTDATATSAA